jgi:alanine racemase
MFESSSILLSKEALSNNILFLKQIFGSQIMISSVIKGNAYGHGITPFVKMASECGICHFSVFSADEAFEASLVLPKPSTIMIMGWVDCTSLEWSILNDIEFFVFDYERLCQAIEISKKISRRAKIHIELETGMNRTGFSANELARVIDLIKDNSSYLSLKGLCTHFAGAENMVNYDRVQNQICVYNDLCLKFTKEGIKPDFMHTACSAASILFPETRLDLVRIGIMQYGLWPSPETYMNYLQDLDTPKDPLKRVISWKSRIMSVKQVKAGDFIGYGIGFVAHEKMKVAAVPVGYSHGFSRSLSNQGRVLIDGKICPVVGTVNMNMMVIDVSEVPSIQKGDEVVLIGKQESQEVTVASFSEFSDQLNYELLTRLPSNIPRIIQS